MYKLLIITKYWSSSGASVHSVVAEFGDKFAADLAASRIENVQDVKCVKLY